MKFTAVVVLCACVWAAAADVADLKAAKVKFLGRLSGRHHKRGVLSAVPPFKLGHDIPLVTHSVIKPVVVTYPPTAAVSAVKVPLSHPLLPRYPVPVGHKVPVPHPHYGLKFPHHHHHHTKTVLLPKPDQHFHHHHHHVEPRPVVPVVPATPVVPVPAPTATIARPILPPSPPVIIPPPAPVIPAPVIPQPSPIPPPLHVLPPNHIHFKPVIPATPFPAPAPVASPLYPVAPHYPYVIRPGGSIQTSLFATYPRYPLINFQSPLIPLGQSAVSQLVPHQYVVPQAEQGGVLQDQVPLQPTPTFIQGEAQQPSFHLEPGVHFHQPAQHPHGAQAEVHVQPEYLQPGVHLHTPQPELHLQPGVQIQPEVHLQGGQPHPDIHFQPQHPDIHLHSSHPEVHIQPGHPDVHLQPGHPEVHLQQGHPDIHLQPGHPDIHQHPEFHSQQPAVDHNGWSPVPQPSPHDQSQHDGHYPEGHHYQEQGNQQGYDQHDEQQYHEYQHQLQHHIQQQLEQAQYEQQFHNQLGQDYGGPQQDFPQHQPASEYGVPQQGAEGRSSAEGEEDTQRYHNHIPLGLQPPIDRPLDHF